METIEMEMWDGMATGDLSPAPKVARKRRGEHVRAPRTGGARGARRLGWGGAAWWLALALAASWWLWTDGPQSYQGTGSWVAAIRAAVGMGAAPMTAQAQNIVYVMLTVSTNALWFVLVARWEDYTATWGRGLVEGALFGLLAVLPLTAIDVGKAAGGFYSLFAPLDLTAIYWPLAAVALAESTVGSVVAQLVTMVMIKRRWGRGDGNG